MTSDMPMTSDMASRLVADVSASTEGEHRPTLAEILDACTEGEASLTPNVDSHAKAEALLLDRARILAELERATHPATRQELQKELRRIGIRLARLNVPASIRRAR